MFFSAALGKVRVVGSDGRAFLEHVFIGLECTKLTLRDEDLVLAHQLAVLQGRVGILTHLRSLGGVRLKHIEHIDVVWGHLRGLKVDLKESGGLPDRGSERAADIDWPGLVLPTVLLRNGHHFLDGHT